MNNLKRENRNQVGWYRRICRNLVNRRLRKIDQGKVVLIEKPRSIGFGEANELNDLATEIEIRDSRFYSSALGGTVSIAASYIRGEWECQDLTSLFRIFLRNRDRLRGLNGMGGALVRGFQHLGHLFRANSKMGSRRNVSAHYDLGNDFYRLWLDDSMAYSCGVFPTWDAPLRLASLEKFDRICRKLQLAPGKRLVEIGTGWGGFAIHAASRYQNHVTTTTLSREQLDHATTSVRSAGLESQIDLLNLDYRDLRGKFDRLVSIEMIEAVGHRFLNAFFQKCSQLLNPDGSMGLQAIVMPDQEYPQYLKSVDFIQRFVFPGGCLPSLQSILSALAKSTDMKLVHLEEMSPHYAETLRRWRAAFEEKLPAIRELGYSEELIRTWRYYLCYCEAAFSERYIGVVQMVLDKPECRRDPLQITTNAQPEEITEMGNADSRENAVLKGVIR